MQVTRRYWAAVALVVFLVVAAIVFAQPLLIVGATGLGAYLLVQQVVFVRSVIQTRDALTVTQSLPREQLPVDETAHLQLDATFAADTIPDAAITLTITPGLPVTATPDAPAPALTIDDTTAATTCTVHWPVAGHFEFEPPTVTVTDTAGLFQSRFHATPSAPPAMTVVPRRPRNLHVGQGDDHIATALGTQKTGAFGVGLEPGEVREYVPGDTVRQIDWKATARSTTPHVRESEEETDRQTMLFIDHRVAMGTGVPGETKLEYGRQVALAVVEHAAEAHEPLGLYTVGDAGLTTRHPPDTGGPIYSKHRTTLHDLTPTAADASMTDRPRRPPTSPTDARRRADRLRSDDSAFATQIRPLVAAAETYIHRIGTDPLYQTVRTTRASMDGTVATLIVTDDQHRAEVREAAKLARNHRGDVHVFLTPTVLFEPDGLTDVATAYDRYVSFEDFRQDLTRLDGVSAYEVAPGDRLDALLATHASHSTAERSTP